MTKELKFKTDRPIKPTPREGVSVEGNEIFGATWSAREVKGRYFFSFTAAGHGGREIEMEIPKDKYEELKNEDFDFKEIIWKYHK